MLTIHQQDLIGMIKDEPEWDPGYDTENQISSILRDKSNPVGLTGLGDDVHIVKEVRAVGIDYALVEATGELKIWCQFHKNEITSMIDYTGHGIAYSVTGWLYFLSILVIYNTENVPK